MQMRNFFNLNTPKSGKCEVHLILLHSIGCDKYQVPRITHNTACSVSIVFLKKLLILTEVGLSRIVVDL